jgi:hypothetical protein
MSALLWLIQSLTVIFGAPPEPGNDRGPLGNPGSDAGGTWDPNG